MKPGVVKGEGYLYPPPEKTNNDIVALVVEKKGDETRTSMRQSEIYAFSPSIRIRDGYMVMPKYHWNAFTEGDWFWTRPLYAVDRFNQQGDERELSDIRKIPTQDFSRLMIPKTTFQHGSLRITCSFVFMPTFIRNRTIRNSYGIYRKLHVMNIGQGFVHNSRQSLFNLNADHVYFGCFEFHAKDNGAVNFASRSEVRDHTNHVLERDAFWELVDLDRNRIVTDKDRKDMWKAMETLQKSAEAYDKQLENAGVYGSASGLLDPPSSNDTMPTVTVTQSNLTHSETLKLVSPFESLSMQSSTEEETEELTDDEDTLTEANDLKLFHTKEELEEYRKQVIVLKVFSENGVVVEKWFDNETHESCVDDDFLNFKFYSRHGITEKTTPISDHDQSILSASALQRIDNQSQSSQVPPPFFQRPTTSAFRRPLTPAAPRPQAFQNQLRNRTMSEGSINIDQLDPLAASTPRPSPEPQRRNMPLVRTIVDGNDSDGDGDFTTRVNETSDTFLLRRDNNANPFRDNFGNR